MNKKNGDLMVSLTHRRRKRPPRNGISRSDGRLRSILTGLLTSGLLAGTLPAQNLNNTGTITNTGTIRVKDQANGLPPTVDGMIEFFGSDQQVPARQYNDLFVSGTGIKTTTGGSFGVTGNVTVASPVVLDVQSGEILSLGGTLNEQGYLSGSIGKTVNLSGSTVSSDFGHIGFEISWNTAAPGVTTVTRTSGTESIGNGNGSILRYYDVAPTFGTGLAGTVVFRYDSRELNGQDSTSLELWRSPDNGLTWRRQGGTVDPALETITKTGVLSFSRWTAADTLHLLGPAAYEWVASDLAATSGNGQERVAGAVLDPFVVTVTDYFGNDIPNATVRFSIIAVPLGATGQSVAADSATTGQNGQASTVLTLGSVPGIYIVAASVDGVAGSPLLFSATARSAAAAMALVSGDAQSDSIRATLAPMSIRITDSGGNPVPGIQVSFALSGAPFGQSGASVSDTLVTTDSLGLAATTLTLGNKTGAYAVRATTTALPGRENIFSATATHGAPQVMLLAAGNNQIDTVLAPLDAAFAVTVTDVGSNPVPGVAVQFTLTDAPAGATGQSLSAPTTSTDTSGKASTVLTLGSKAGIYRIEARAQIFGLGPVTFVAEAMAGVPAVVAAAGGDGQAKVVAATLDTAFVIRMTDAGGNPIQGIHVDFALSSTPSGATGQSLSAAVAHTDVNGEASTVLTLGTKAGNYVVTASSDTVAGSVAVFTARAVAGAAATMTTVAGDGQTGPAGLALNVPLAIRLRDVYDNAVPGVMVTFAFATVPNGATGQSFNPASTVTDSLGEAASVLVLGSYPGAYSVTASVANLPAASFTATATIQLADVNNDRDVDIADLTSIVDHILGRLTLTGVDSIKADVNRDGALNVLDVQSLVNYLLGAQQLAAKAESAPQHPRLHVESINGTAVDSVVGQLEITPLGLRFNLANQIPVKGVQLYVRLKAPVSAEKADLVFKRAGAMSVIVRSAGDEMFVLAYNLANTPVEEGAGSLFRLPVVLHDSTEIDSAFAVVSVGDTLYDVALRVPLTVKLSPDAYPATFSLLQNYPNPFNGETKIVFEVPDLQGRFARTMVQVFNILGEKVKTLTKGEFEGGRYMVSWDATDAAGDRVPSGIYFYRLISGDEVITRKMVLIK